MKTIIMTAFKWFPILLVAILLGAIAWGVKGCYDTKATNVLLVADTTAKGLKIGLYRSRIDTLLANVSILKRTLTKADSNFSAAQIKHKSQLLNIQNFVASATAQQKKDTVIKLIGVPIMPADSVRPTVIYTERQNDGILTAILDAETLKRQRDTVTRLQANQEARIELIGVRIREAIQAERKRKHILGIGQKKGLNGLEKTTDYIIESTY